MSPERSRVVADARRSPLHSLTPNSAILGETGVVLTTRGSGFNEFTAVSIDPWLPATTTVWTIPRSWRGSKGRSSTRGYNSWPGFDQVFLLRSPLVGP